MNSDVLTPAAGKPLIGRFLARHPAVPAAYRKNNLVFGAGTPNGYVAQKMLKETGSNADTPKRRLCFAIRSSQ